MVCMKERALGIKELRGSQEPMSAQEPQALFLNSGKERLKGCEHRTPVGTVPL